MLTVPYEHAVLLQSIPTDYPHMLCFNTYCGICPATTNPRSSSSIGNCQFVLYYKTNYPTLFTSLRKAAREQWPPDRYPELYI